MFYNLKNNSLYISMLLVLSLLLITNNFSVGVIAITIILSLISIFKNGVTKLNSFDKLIICIFFSYFLGAIPVAIADGSTLRYFQGGARLLLCLPIYLFIRNHTEISISKAIKAMQIGSIIGSTGAFLFAVYQYFILGMPRVDGYLFSINYGYLACSLMFINVSLSYKSNMKLLLYFAATAALISTVLTFTRGAILAIPLLLCFAAILNFKYISLKKFLLLLISFVLISITVYYTSSAVQQRTDFTINEVSYIINGHVAESSSTGARLQLWVAASYAFKNAPITGLPYSEREKLNQQLFENDVVSDWVATVARGHAHSQYFEMLASNGIWGIISIIFIFFIPLYIFTKHYLNNDSIIGFTAALFVAGFMIYGLTEVPLQANLIGSYYGFMLAVFFAIVHQERYPNVEKKS
ncbi:O-antigen ligase family protein [Vibrio diazotrophicus]|uniref:O-antigen ligase family protein n=1 Tax=Vibrio diazotrophicus TaxID=685 RepID=UPI000C9E5ECE|nr:O-antigen ligase family protein [Vibrio diazotrophicus]PNH80598.1 ligase [Vibrio diazotrophicus]